MYVINNFTAEKKCRERGGGGAQKETFRAALLYLAIVSHHSFQIVLLRLLNPLRSTLHAIFHTSFSICYELERRGSHHHSILTQMKYKQLLVSY